MPVTMAQIDRFQFMAHLGRLKNLTDNYDALGAMKGAAKCLLRR